MLVLGLFNAAIGINDIRQDLFYDELSPERAWVSEMDDRHCIKVGSRVSFLVKSVQEDDEFIDIAGSLVPPNTGALDWLECVNEDERVKVEDKQAEPSGNSEKKKRHKGVKLEDAQVVQAEPSERENNHKGLKVEDPQVEQTEPSNNQKKKKHKKQSGVKLEEIQEQQVEPSSNHVHHRKETGEQQGVSSSNRVKDKQHKKKRKREYSEESQTAKQPKA